MRVSREKSQFPHKGVAGSVCKYRGCHNSVQHVLVHEHSSVHFGPHNNADTRFRVQEEGFCMGILAPLLLDQV